MAKAEARPAKTGQNRAILVALGAVVVLFLATLPWQRRQWAQVAQAQKQSALQETRVQEIANAREDLAAAEARVRAAPDDLEARITVASLLADRRDFSHAAAHLRAVEPAAARSPELAGTLSSLYQKIGYLDRAVAMARLEKRLAPDSSEALLRLGYLYTQLGWQANIRDLFLQAAARAPASAEPHLALALWYSETGGDYEAAEKELAAADRLRPGDWRIALLLAQNLHAQRRYDDALNALDRGLRLAPAEPQLFAQQADVLLDQARGQHSGEKINFEPTLRAAQRCLSLDPDNPGAHYLLGEIYRDDGSEEMALREWQQVQAADPDFPGLRVDLGRLLVRQGNAEEGRRLIAEGQRRRAEDTEFNRLVVVAGMNPENPEHHRRLARWCLTHGRYSRAILEWEEVLARQPGDKEAQEGLRRSRALRGDPM